MENIVSIPYTSWKGDMLIDIFMQTQSTDKEFMSFLCQFVLFSCRNFLIMFTNDLFDGSSNSLPWGYYVVEFPSIMWYLSENPIIFLDLKAVAFPFIIFCGQARWDIIFFSKNWLMMVSIAFLMGMAPLFEVIGGNEYPIMLIWWWRMDLTNEIKTSLLKRCLTRNWFQG